MDSNRCIAGLGSSPSEPERNDHSSAMLTVTHDIHGLERFRACPNSIVENSNNGVSVNRRPRKGWIHATARRRAYHRGYDDSAVSGPGGAIRNRSCEPRTAA